MDLLLDALWILAMLLAGADQVPAQSDAQGQHIEPARAAGQELEHHHRELKQLRLGQPVGQADDALKKQVELQQKQIEVLEKMVRLLVEQQKSQTAAVESRFQQAARRDQELAHVTDDLREHFDAESRQGPELPATLKEKFLPSRTNQSPLSIHGTLAADFQDFQDSRGNFPSPAFSTHFYLLLNERFLLEANPEFRGDGVSLESAQLDWFLHDNFTLVVGRFYSPLGFFNERLHTSWIFKTPDRPLMFQQVFPSPLSFNGVQLRGACYLFDLSDLCDLGDLGELPVKLEYSGFVTNGFSLDVAAPTARDFADFFRMKEPFNDVNNDKAIGGRVGLSLPTIGLIAGISGLANGAYDRAGQHDLSVWDVDLSWHWENWDVRVEYARTHQQAPGSAIDREGFYAQAAYRPHDSIDYFLQKLEGVLRYDYVRFDGIDLGRTGLAFGPRERVPVDRNRYTFGLNYYAYESLIVKFAYEINDEVDFREMDDNGFLAQVSWGF